jgi:uncharacterized protein (TIGR00369 family)
MDQQDYLDTVRRHFTESIPHVRECGMQVAALASGAAYVQLPYRHEWLGDSERGLINTGIVATLVDTASGLAVFAALERFQSIATLDLRMDYLRPALPEKTLHCRAQCYRMTTHIAFARAQVWQDDETQPLAVSQSAFMRSSRARTRPGPAS